MSLVQAITAHPQIAAALQNASAQTGADFGYLLDTAMRESSLNCSAKSGTSTACGLFQFTQQTWLGTIKQSGAELGLGQYADQISQDANGRYVVADPAARKEILALRNDPNVSALMAGAYATASKDRLEAGLGRSVDSGELYIAHFLGAGGAVKLISSAEDTPNARADLLFPQAAAANRSIFYDASGQAKTVSEVYQGLVSKHRDGSTPQFEIAPAPQLAAANDDVNDTEVATAATAAQTRSLSLLANALAPSRTKPATGSSGISQSGGLGARSVLQLSPVVVQILSSLDVPAGADTSSKPADERKAEERSVMLPHSGFAFG